MLSDFRERTRRRLSATSWFHGTTFENWPEFCKKGIDIEYNKTESDSLDFGYGFYLTDSRNQALEYMLREIRNDLIDRQSLLILEFEFCPAQHLVKDKFRIFEKHDDDFATFIFNNRLNNFAGNRQHSYDWIYGGMSDSLPTKVIKDYRENKLTYSDAIEQLKKPVSMKQLSIHSQEISSSMHLKTALKYDVNVDFSTEGPQELDIYEYNKKST